MKPGAWKFFFGPHFAADYIGTSNLTYSLGKSLGEGTAFSLQSSVDPDALLQKFDIAADAYEAEACPGKVKSYRFMSFYLKPDQANSDAFLQEVVDPRWLEYSDDPNAAALRQANIGNPAWRVLHRVTYIERVPPRPGSVNAAEKSAKEPLPVIQVEDNRILLLMVMRSLRAHNIDLTSPTPAQLGEAVKDVLESAPTGNARYPRNVADVVPWWAGIADRTRNRDPKTLAWVNPLRRRILETLLRGYENEQLPLDPGPAS